MLVVRATKKLLDRLGPVTLESEQTSTTRLGDWYASAWAWRPQVALFVSEATLFPILMPLAPAATLLARFPDGLAQALAAHDVPEAFITQELSRMQEVRLGKTASRSVLGIMNEFTFLAQTMRGDTTTDLTDLARWLARTPCSPCSSDTAAPTANCAHWSKRPTRRHPRGDPTRAHLTRVPGADVTHLGRFCHTATIHSSNNL